MNRAQKLVNRLLHDDAKTAARDWLRQVDPDSARDAVRTELKRTNDYERAKETALNNLSKDPDYYKKLNRYGLDDVHRRAPQPIR